MKKLLPLLLSLLLLVAFLPKQAGASQIMGLDMSWKCLGNDSFLITIIAYGDCNGSGISPSPIKIAGIGCSFVASAATSISAPVDVTPTCEGSCTRCDHSSCSFPFGINKYTLTSVVDFSTASCCEFKLSWDQCCRSASISTGAANEHFYTEAYMNTCNTPCNSSPRFTSSPVALLCAGQCVVFNPGAVDDEGDSLVYSIADPLQGAGTPTGWIAPYSSEKPLFFNGFPDAGLPFNPPICQGFHLDSLTGDMRFRPMQAQNTVMAIKVDEFRNGQKIGTTTRNMELMVMNCPPNEEPMVSGMDYSPRFDVTVHPGTQLCFDIYTRDLDQNDTVTLTWSGGIPGATFTTHGLRHPIGTFCWTPQLSDTSSVPYYFSVTAQDDACPVAASTTRVFKIVVDPHNHHNSILENDFGPDLAIFPNPTAGKASVTLGKYYEHVTATIKNVAGQVVATQEASSTDRLELEIEGAAGVYLVELKSASGEAAVIKVVKE